MPIPSQTGAVRPFKRATEATTPIAKPPAVFNNVSAMQRSTFSPISSSEQDPHFAGFFCCCGFSADIFSL